MLTELSFWLGKYGGKLKGGSVVVGGVPAGMWPWGVTTGSGDVPGLLIPEPPEADELSEEASEDEVFIFCDKELLLLWLLLLDIFASIDNTYPK